MSAMSTSRKVTAGLLSASDGFQQDRSLSPVGGQSKHVAIEMDNITGSRQDTNSSNGSQGYDTSSFIDRKCPEDGKQSSLDGISSNDDSSAQQIKVSSRASDGNGGDSPLGDNMASRSRENTFQSDRSAAQSVSLPGSRLSTQNSGFELPKSRAECSLSAEDECSAGDLDSEYYCVDHMRLCTSEEAQTVHAACEFLVPAVEWAEAQTMERDRNQIEDKLKSFETFAGTLLEERNDFKKQLMESKEDVTDEFLDVVEDLIAHLLSKQKQFMKNLDEMHDGHMKTINAQIKRCMKIQKETSVSMEQLSCCANDNDEFKKLSRNIMEKCPVYEEILRRDFNNSSRLDYEFKPDPMVERFLKDMTSLGDVTSRPSGSKLPGFLSQSTLSDFSQRQLRILSRNDGVSGVDTSACCFTGCTYVSGGKMLLTDWNNACLKMFNKRGVLCDRIGFPNNPWDVKVVNEEIVVVTVPGERKVVFVDISGKEMQIVSTFDTDCECWAVAVLGDKLAMTCDPWSKSPSVRVYTLDGTYVSFYQKDSKERQLFAFPEHVTTDSTQTVLYISDSRLHTVIALTVEGCLLFRYQHDQLAYPSGVTTDCQGYIYVCGKESHNIHQISKSGELMQILMQDDDLEAPRAIGFQQDGDNFIVTDVGNTNCDDFITARLE